MQIDINEIEIEGHWIFDGSKMTSDDNCQRIFNLTTNYLVKITTDKSGWNILYQDPNDNRYWEMIYKNSGWHGGGPPTLFNINEQDAKNKYGI